MYVLNCSVFSFKNRFNILGCSMFNFLSLGCLKRMGKEVDQEEEEEGLGKGKKNKEKKKKQPQKEEDLVTMVCS